MAKVKDENHYVIQGWMINKLGLKGVALNVFAIIYGFTQDGETEFNGSRQYLCDFTGATKPTIDKALNELVEKKFIIKTSNKINNITFNKFKVDLYIVKNYTTGKETLLGGKEILLGSSKETLLGGKETLSNNININNNLDNNKNNIYIDIFDTWNAQNIIKHKELNQEIEKVIDKLLNVYTKEDIKRSIEHYGIIYNDKDYYFNYKWSLLEFLKQKNAMPDFLDNGSKWLNYQSKNKYNKIDILKELYEEENQRSEVYGII